MTPTEQDKGLREELYRLLNTDPRGDTYVIPYRVMDIIVDFITADRKRVALEARIDERNKERHVLLKEYRFVAHNSGFGRQLATNLKYNADRIAELKAQQGKL